MKNKTVLIVGGAGFIGSMVNKTLNEAGYRTVVLDNLSTGNRKAVTRGTFVEGDIGDPIVLKKIFKEHAVDAVMHFAALIDVGESVKDPLKYYKNNVSNTVQLLQTMLEYGVKTFIFSSSAAVYGAPLEKKIKETRPCRPLNPYGESKLMVEYILRDCNLAYGLKYSSLRYFNAAGGDPSGEIKNFKIKESNLIPLALRSLINPQGSLTIFGTDYPTPDGTCIRDYIHVYDLATAHLLAMEQLFSGNDSTIYNLGNGCGYSVKEVTNAVEKVTGKKLNLLQGERRAGDPSILVADSKKAERELGWTQRFSSLDKMIDDAWKALA